MSAPERLPPVSVQESVIESALNGTLINNCLAGIYSVVYIGTLYFYYTGKSVQRGRVVISIITIQYVAYLLQFVGEWYMLKITIIDQGATREKLFIAVAFSPGWGNLINVISSFLLSSLADTLLIWRCFHVWDGSFRVVIVPFVILLVEIGRYILPVPFIVSKVLNEKLRKARVLNELISAALFTTFACTLSTTLLIIYRLYPIANRDRGINTSAQRFKHIVDILIQSAALYSLAALAYAISSVLPLDNTQNTALVSAQIYSSSLFLFVAGVAPTGMVARVTLSKTENSQLPKLTHLSGLEFEGQTTTVDGIGISGGNSHSSVQDVEKSM